MPTPKRNETQDEFISRCIPYVIHEGTTKDEKQASAICYSIWKRHKGKNSMKKERVLLHLSTQLQPTQLTKLGEGDISLDTTMIVGDGKYNGIFFPAEELEKSYMSFDGVPININHSDDKIEDIVGYVKEPYMEGNKLKARTIFDSNTSKYDAAMGYVQSRFDAGDYPNVSIGVWLDRVEEPLSEDSKERRLTARNLKADHLAIVVHGACNPNDGCGIGLEWKPQIPIDRITLTINSDTEDYPTKINNLMNEIEIEKLKKQIIIERNKKEMK